MRIIYWVFSASSFARLKSILLVIPLTTTNFFLPEQALAAVQNPMWEFTELGRVLGPADVGVPNGSDLNGVSDQSVVVLPDGQIRLYFNKNLSGAPSFGIMSAISKDGKKFAVEPGERIPAPSNGESTGSGFIYALPTGGYRFYGVRHGAVVSWTSSDGLTFTSDSGERIPAGQFKNARDGSIVCSAIVPTSKSRYRIYCTIRITAAGGPGNPGVGAVVSALSSDLVNWTVEDGIRLGPGSNLSADAGHPSVISASKDGAVTLVYHSYNYSYPVNDVGSIVNHKSGTAEVIASSKDGLNFSNPIVTGVFGAEVAWASVSPTTAYMYVGGANNRDGDFINVAAAKLVTKGIALNFVDLPQDVTGGIPSIIISSAVGATCSIKVKDAKGKALNHPRLTYRGKIGKEGLISWTWQISPSTNLGKAQVSATCSLGSNSRTRTANFQILV